MASRGRSLRSVGSVRIKRVQPVVYTMAPQPLLSLRVRFCLGIQAYLVFRERIGKRYKVVSCRLTMR